VGVRVCGCAGVRRTTARADCVHRPWPACEAVSHRAASWMRDIVRAERLTESGVLDGAAMVLVVQQAQPEDDVVVGGMLQLSYGELDSTEAAQTDDAVRRGDAARPGLRRAEVEDDSPAAVLHGCAKCHVGAEVAGTDVVFDHALTRVCARGQASISCCSRPEAAVRVNGCVGVFARARDT